MNLIERLKKEFFLPYLPGTSGGLDSVLLGAFPLLGNNLELQNRISLEIDPRKLDHRPLRTKDPVGFLFAEQAAASRTRLVEELRTAKPSGRLRVLLAAHWNAYHLVLFRPSLELIRETCMENKVCGLDDFRNDTALLHRLKQQALHLYFKPDPDPGLLGLSAAELRGKAEEKIRQISPKFRLYRNRREAKVVRRTRKSDPATDRVSVRMRLVLPIETRLQLCHAAAREEFEDEISKAEAEREDASRDTSLGQLLAASRRQTKVLSALPFRQGLTESTLSMMRSWYESNWRTSSSALLLALADIAWLSDESFPSARVEWNGSAAYLVTSCPWLTRNAPFSPELHLQVGEEFWRRIPGEMAKATEELLGRPDQEKLLQDRDLVLRDRFLSSYAKMRDAHRYNAPVWDNVSWLGSEFGFNPVRFDEHGKLKMPGYRSYVVWDPSVHEARIIDSLQMRGWEIAADPEIQKIPRCGSRNCPRPEVISEMVNVLDRLIRQATNQLPGDYMGAACLMNAISSLTRLLELLLTFGRNYPGEAPRVFRCGTKYYPAGCVQIRREKIRPRALVYGSQLNALLKTVTATFASFFSHSSFSDFKKPKFRWEKNCEEAMSFSYAFLQRDTDKRGVVLQHPRKALIADGLLHHPETERFGGLALNGMRNMDYYLLTSIPALEREVMNLCDHLPAGGSGPAYHGSGASFASRVIRQNAATAMLLNTPWPWQ